jgi:tetratricopeptide (TPR) repeat protein
MNELTPFFHRIGVTMREPLLPMEAYTVDVGEGNRWAGHPTQPHGWFSVTHIAMRVASLPPERRQWFLDTLPEEVLPTWDRRPTHVCHDCPPPTDPIAIAAEQFRIAAEDMERDGCFEMAYTTVSAAARLAATVDPSGTLSACNHLARIVRQLGETREAEALYEGVLSEARQRGFPSVAGYALTGLGNLAVMRGNRPAQLGYYAEALQLAPQGTALEAAARWGLMNHALAMNSLADALIHGWRAYDLSVTAEERAGILSNLASVAYHGGFVEQAVDGFARALDMTTTPRLWLSVASAAAPAAGAAGRHTLLEQLEADGRPHSAAAGPFESSEWLLGLAQGWASVGRWEAAERCAQQGRALAQLHEFHEVVYRLDAVLSQIASQSADPAVSAPAPDPDALPAAARRGLARLSAVER